MGGNHRYSRGGYTDVEIRQARAKAKAEWLNSLRRRRARRS